MWRQPKRGWVGVDLGEGAIKVAQLCRADGRLRLEAACVSPRSADSLIDDLRSAKALADGLSGSRTAATLSMLDSLVEPMSGEPTRSADRCVDGWDGGPQSAYALSTSTRRVESAIDQLARVGLQCGVIDGPPLALARALPLSPGYRHDALLGVIDWGEAATTFVAAQGGHAKYVRQIKDAGFASMRAEVAERLGLTARAAERALTRHGIGEGPDASPEARTINDTLRTRIRPVIDELRRTLEHLGGKLRTKPPEKVFVLGYAALVPGLPAAVGRALNLPCEPWTAQHLDRSAAASDAPDCLLAQAIALSALAW